MAYSVGEMPPVHLYGTFIEDLHQMGYRGQGVTVSVVDSGVDLSDPITKTAVSGGVNLTGAGQGDIQDRIGHGALVARIILTMAPEAKIVPIRIFGTTNSCTDDLVGAGLIEGARRGDLTNASIGGDESPQCLKGIAAHAGFKKPLIASAGNSGDGSDTTSEREWPAADEYTTAIGAVDRGAICDTANEIIPLRPARYSVSNPYVDGVAVGRIPHRYNEGTSFAAPVVTGMLACYISFAKATGRPWDDDACYAWLVNNCRQLPGFAPRNNQTGYGMFTLRPYNPPSLVEVDVQTLETFVNSRPADLGKLENRAPGGIYGWFRPFLEGLGKRVDYDESRKRAQYWI